MALRLIGEGMLVGIAPGASASDMDRPARDHAAEVGADIPAGRTGDADDMAAAASSLASRAGGDVVGSMITIDGGQQPQRPLPEASGRLGRVEPTPRYWFPAMRHGWGWGWPRTWEGWLVLAAYLTSVLTPAVLLPERAAGLVTVLALAVGTPLLLWVCFTKGEPPDSAEGPPPR